MPRNPSRLIVFGDVHACHEEWQDLLDQLKVTSKDRLVSVGDLVCKGPSTKKTLDMAMSMKNLQCVVGNHEMHLLLHWRENRLGQLHKEYQKRALAELGKDTERYMKYLDRWPFYLDLPECIVVHAGIRPNAPLERQTPEDLVSLRKIEPDKRPWYDFYTDEKLIVHGHWAKHGLIVRDNSIGLDTGCVYGRELTALILPERKFVSVKARKQYEPFGT